MRRRKGERPLRQIVPRKEMETSPYPSPFAPHSSKEEEEECPSSPDAFSPPTYNAHCALRPSAPHRLAVGVRPILLVTPSPLQKMTTWNLSFSFFAGEEKQFVILKGDRSFSFRPPDRCMCAAAAEGAKGAVCIPNDAGRIQRRKGVYERTFNFRKKPKFFSPCF